MRRPVALCATVSMSEPDHRLVVGNADGPITDWPEWVSLSVRLHFDLDDETRVSTAKAKWLSGGPLDCTRPELEARIRKLVFGHPRFAPGDPRAVPPLIVEELADHGVDATLEELEALPFTFDVSDEVEAERAAQARTGGQAA